MIEAYRIGVELVLGGDLAAGIEALIPGLNRLDESLTHSNAEAAGLSKALHGVGSAAPGIARTAEALNALHTAMTTVNRAIAEHHAAGGMPSYNAGAMPSGSHVGPAFAVGAALSAPEAGTTVLPHVTSNALVPSYVPNFTMPPPAGHPGFDAAFNEEGEGRIPLNPNGRRNTAAGGPHRSGGHMEGAFDGVIPALVTGELLKSLFDASFKVGAAQSELLTNGWTPEQVAKARELAQAVQVSTPGANIGSGLEVLKDLGALFRKADGTPDVEAAMAALPAYARDALVLGRHGGNGVNELFAAARAGDLKGELSKPGTDEIDPDKFTAFVHKVVLADITSGGRVTPQMILQNMKTGGVASAMMSDQDFFGANLAMIEGLGPQAASALSGFNRQFGAGRMGQGIAQELEEVFPHLAGHWHSTGMGMVAVDPGAMGDPQKLSEHPFQYIRDELIPGIDKIIEKRFPDFKNWDAQKRLVYESQEGSRIAASVTGAKEIVAVMRLWPQMVRMQEAFANSQKTDPYAIQQQTNPEMKMKGLQAAWNAFEVSAGEAGQGPAIAALNAVTEWLNGIAKWTGDHPDGTKAALEGLSFGILALGAEKVLVALSSLGGGGKGGLYGLAGGILALSGAMDHMPEWLQNGVKGAVAGGTLGGAPGAVAGGIGGSIWNLNPFGLNDVTPADVWHHVFGGGTKSPDDGKPSVHLQSFHPDPAPNGPVVQHITYLKLDGRTIAKAVTRHQTDMMGNQVNGTIRPDPSIAPQYGAHLMET